MPCRSGEWEKRLPAWCLDYPFFRNEDVVVFSSHIFVFYFLPVVLALYYAAPRSNRNVILTCFSYFFYGWTNPTFLFLIAWSTAVDYCCGNLISGWWCPLGSVGIDDAGRQVPPRWQKTLALVVSLFSN